LRIESIGELIPIIAIILGIGMVIVAIVTKHWRDMHRLELQHRERMAAIEKGLELPPEGPATTATIIRGSSYRAGETRYLLRGLVWLGIGLAIALTDTGVSDKMHGYGWIAAAVGVAYLVYYAIEGRKEESPPSREPPPPPSNHA
jgi:hypothetical protein